MCGPHCSSNGPSADELPARFSVIFAFVSVDQHVDGGVDGQEKVADGEHDQDAFRAAALLDPLQLGQLVNVDEEPGEAYTA